MAQPTANRSVRLNNHLIFLSLNELNWDTASDMLTGLSKTARNIAKRAAITGALEAANLVGGRRFGVSSPGLGIIFTLHHVRPKKKLDFDPNAHLEITPEFLAQAIEETLKAGYLPISLNDLPAHMADPNPQKPVVIFTLDDGYSNNFDYALPIFERYNVPFTVFVTTGFMDRSHAPWWETLVTLLNSTPVLEFELGGGTVRFDLTRTYKKQKALERIISFFADSDEAEAVAILNDTALAYGIEPLADPGSLVMCADRTRAMAKHPLVRVGAHSVSHRNLRRLDDQGVADEMTMSANRLAEIVGYRPTTFAYPYGFSAAVSKREIDIARELGFQVAVTTRPGTLKAEDRGRMTALPRVSLNGLYQKQRYVKALTSGIPFRFLK